MISKLKLPRQLCSKTAELQKRKVDMIFTNKKTNCSLAHIDRLVRKKKLCVTNANVIAELFIKAVDTLEKKWIMPFSVLILNTVNNYHRTIPFNEIVQISNILYRKQNEKCLHQTHLPNMRRRLRGIIKMAAETQEIQELPIQFNLDEDADGIETDEL